MQEPKPKCLWHSNSPWSPTGYGSQTALFAPKLKDHYDLGISAFYGLEGNLIPWNGIPVMPGMGQTHGNEALPDHANVFLGGMRGGLVVTLMDVWVLDPAVFRQMNVASWCPVDHEPVPPPVAGYFRNSGAVPIAMSRFGETMLEEFDPLYVPHGVDCDMLKPIRQTKARDVTGMPKDAFIVGMVAANKGNPSRKCFSEAFQAFKAFHDRHPEAQLYLHTEATGKFDGVDLPQLATACGLDPADLLFCDQYRAIHYPFPLETMAAVYSSLDVLLAPSAGEGFGIPTVEAQACGVPVIVSDFSAQPELCGAGWTVSGTKHYTPLKAWQFRPDVEDIVEALDRVYSMPAAGRKQCAGKAREFAEQYDADRVFGEFMLPALEQAAERFAAREPVLVAA